MMVKATMQVDLDLSQIIADRFLIESLISMAEKETHVTLTLASEGYLSPHPHAASSRKLSAILSLHRIK
jgi:hypothetical protein